MVGGPLAEASQVARYSAFLLLSSSSAGPSGALLTPQLSSVAVVVPCNVAPWHQNSLASHQIRLFSSLNYLLCRVRQVWASVGSSCLLLSLGVAPSELHCLSGAVLVVLVTDRSRPIRLGPPVKVVFLFSYP
jgi:hypothetical protein